MGNCICFKGEAPPLTTTDKVYSAASDIGDSVVEYGKSEEVLETSRDIVSDGVSDFPDTDRPGAESTRSVSFQEPSVKDVPVNGSIASAGVSSKTLFFKVQSATITNPGPATSGVVLTLEYGSQTFRTDKVPSTSAPLFDLEAPFVLEDGAESMVSAFIRDGADKALVGAVNMDVERIISGDRAGYAGEVGIFKDEEQTGTLILSIDLKA